MWCPTTYNLFLEFTAIYGTMVFVLRILTLSGCFFEKICFYKINKYIFVFYISYLYFYILSLYYFPWHWPSLGGKKSITSWITVERHFICNKDILKHSMYKKSPNYFCYSRAQKALPWQHVRHFFFNEGPEGLSARARRVRPIGRLSSSL